MDTRVASKATSAAPRPQGPSGRQGAAWRGGTVLDGLIHAAQGRASGGLSPVAQGLAYLDWGVHLANAPFRRAQLAASAVNKAVRFGDALMGETAIAPSPGDHRFQDPAWSQPPFSLYAQAFLLAEEWWNEAANGPPGIRRRRSARRRVRHTPMGRHVFALERAVAQSGGHPRDPRDGRRQFPPGGGQLRRRRPGGVRSAAAAPRRSASGAISPPLPARWCCATI